MIFAHDTEHGLIEIAALINTQAGTARSDMHGQAMVQ